MHPVRQHIVTLAAKEIGRGDRTRYYPGVLPDAGSPNLEWCGIFLLWVLHQAGLMKEVRWEYGKGFLYRLPNTSNPQPGDMGYKHHLNHQNLVVALDEDPRYLWTIDGNSMYGKVTGPNRQRKSDFAAFYSVEPLLKDAPMPPSSVNWGIIAGMSAAFGLGAYLIWLKRK